MPCASTSTQVDDRRNVRDQDRCASPGTGGYLARLPREAADAPHARHCRGPAQQIAVAIHHRADRSGLPSRSRLCACGQADRVARRPRIPSTQPPAREYPVRRASRPPERRMQTPFEHARPTSTPLSASATTSGSRGARRATRRTDRPSTSRERHTVRRSRAHDDERRGS